MATEHQPSDYYIGRTVEAFQESRDRHPTRAFRDSGNKRPASEFSESRALLEPFIVRFYPILRHYRPDIVGRCLALSFDDPELGRSSELHGFGMDMKAGDHPQDRESRQGSFRDDGSYLALMAYDYFEGSLRP